MTVLADPPRATPEELLARAELKEFELVGGRLVERHSGAEASWIGGELLTLLRAATRTTNAGWVFPSDQSYQCFPEDPTRVRKPDVSFIRRGRLEGERIPRGHTQIAPDLAVEVISPNDLFSEVRVKVEEYLRAGVLLVWVIDPDSRTVEVRRADGGAAFLHAEDELTGEDVLPGFRCRVGELFPPEGEEA